MTGEVAIRYVRLVETNNFVARHRTRGMTLIGLQ